MNFIRKYGVKSYKDLLTEQKRQIVKSFRRRVPLIAVMVASFGVGKTSTIFAMVKALFCESNSDERPCGACPACVFAEQHFHSGPCVHVSVPGHGTLHMYDCTVMKPEHISDIFDAIALYGRSTDIFVFDEFHRLDIKIQERFLTLLESDIAPSILFCLATDNVNNVAKPILERFHIFRLNKPTEDEAIALINRVVIGEGMRIVETDSLRVLAIGCARIPRVILKAMQMLVFDGDALSQQTVSQVLKRLSIVEEGK